MSLRDRIEREVADALAGIDVREELRKEARRARIEEQQAFKRKMRDELQAFGVTAHEVAQAMSRLAAAGTTLAWTAPSEAILPPIAPTVQTTAEINVDGKVRVVELGDPRTKGATTVDIPRFSGPPAMSLGSATYCGPLVLHATRFTFEPYVTITGAGRWACTKQEEVQL